MLCLTIVCLSKRLQSFSCNQFGSHASTVCCPSSPVSGWLGKEGKRDPAGMAMFTPRRRQEVAMPGRGMRSAIGSSTGTKQDDCRVEGNFPKMDLPQALGKRAWLGMGQHSSDLWALACHQDDPLRRRKMHQPGGLHVYKSLTCLQKVIVLAPPKDHAQAPNCSAGPRFKGVRCIVTCRAFPVVRPYLISCARLVY